MKWHRLMRWHQTRLLFCCGLIGSRCRFLHAVAQTQCSRETLGDRWPQFQILQWGEKEQSAPPPLSPIDFDIFAGRYNWKRKSSHSCFPRKGSALTELHGLAIRHHMRARIQGAICRSTLRAYIPRHEERGEPYYNRPGRILLA